MLYGDTDSVFVALGNPQKAEALRQRVEASIDARIRREYGASQGVLYRLSHDGTVRDTDLSLRKMLHHLKLKAQIARNGNTYVVEADPAVKPSAGAQDW